MRKTVEAIETIDRNIAPERMIIMSQTFLSLPTYTTAAMAHELLKKHGIPSDITRTAADRNSSCGYSIKIDSRHASQTRQLLSQSRYPVQRVTETP